MPAWVSGLIVTSLSGVHICEGSQTLTSFHPQAISASRWFTPLLNLRVYFTPLPRPGILAYSGASPFVQLCSLIESHDPLLFLCESLTGKPVATSTYAASRLCSARRSVLCVRGLAAHSVAPLFRFLASPGDALTDRNNYLSLDIHAVDFFDLHRDVDQ